MDVAILGGGIGGLATAVSLRQIGMTVSVYERRSSANSLGAGIVCWPNASFVLSELGLLDELRAVSSKVVGMQRLTSDGGRLGLLNVRLLDDSMGYPSLAVLRRDLIDLLLRRAEKLDIPIHFSCQATAIDPDGDQCRVRFDDGRFIAPNLIIGADGRMSSIARQFITGDSRPVFQKFLNWIGIARRAPARSEAGTICDYWGVGARFGIVPVSNDTVYWAGGVAINKEHFEDTAEDIDHLHTTFAGWPAPVRDIVSQTSKVNTKRVVLYDHEPVSVWHKGNVLMIGDAAHAALPTSGQGAAQALEDAWCLQQEMIQSQGNMESVLARFTQRRREKTKRITMAARAFAATLFNTDSDECKQRNRAAIQTNYTSMVAGMASGWSAGLPFAQE